MGAVDNLELLVGLAAVGHYLSGDACRQSCPHCSSLWFVCGLEFAEQFFENCLDMFNGLLAFAYVA